jgi:hypothetical protein
MTPFIGVSIALLFVLFVGSIAWINVGCLVGIAAHAAVLQRSARDQGVPETWFASDGECCQQFVLAQPIDVYIYTYVYIYIYIYIYIHIYIYIW